MDFVNSLFFLLLILALLWVIKLDLFFMVFGTVVLLYFIIQLFFMDPIEIFFSIGSFFLLNPFGVLILFVPLIIYALNLGLKKKDNS
ncbi:MAG: hypothetical protein ACFE9N_10430 [Promethearchaeota archaeon]